MLFRSDPATKQTNVTGIKPYVPFGAPMDAQGNVAPYGGQQTGMGWGAYGQGAQQAAGQQGSSPYGNYGFDQNMVNYLNQQRQASSHDGGISYNYDPATQTFKGYTLSGPVTKTLAQMQQEAGGAQTGQQASTNYPAGTMQAGMGPGEQLAAQSSVAGPSGLQQQAYNTAANMQVPGQYGQATDIGRAAGLGLLNTAGQAQGLQSLAQQAIQQGRQYAQDITDPSRTQAFMSPYMQNVVNTQQREAQRQADIARTKRAGEAVSKGAFGGSRQALVEAEANRNLATQMGDIQAQGLQNAFQNAQQQQLNAQNQAMQGYNTGIQGYGQGITGQTGAYGQASQGAGTLSNIGGQQLGSQQSIANLQNTLGQQQQANQQQIINQAMQNYQMQRMYPQQQLSYLGSLLSGLPVSSTGQVTNIPAPSMMSQLAGLGMTGIGAAGLYKNLTDKPLSTIFSKKGGAIKAPKTGGNGLMDVALAKIGA